MMDEQHRFAHLAQRIFNVPLAITPAKAEMIVAALAQRLGIAHLVRTNGTVVAFDDDYAPEETEAKPVRRGYTMIGPAAVIPVQGTLVQKLGSLTPYSGMTGYDGLRINLLTALEDKAVRGIVWDVDSPGGEVSGLFDLADTIYSARKRKPSWAILSENAYSAGYALASCCDRVIVPRTGGTGSIGVICMHVDMSKWLSKEGIAVTLIQYGERKGDGSQYKPLSDQALKNAQADIDAMGAMFDDLVARNRKMPAARVKSYQAGTFMGPRGVAAGLADTVMAPDAAMRAFLSTL
jgi:signal peptide peptidase SppA